MIKGTVYVLGKNVDTDQAIPAKHLVYSLDDPEEKKFYDPHALSGVADEQSRSPQREIPFVKNDNFEFENEISIIVDGSNFGCGSSRATCSSFARY